MSSVRARMALGLCGLWPSLGAAFEACPSNIAHDGVWLEYADRTVLTRVLSDGRNAETEYAHEGGTIHGFITLASGLVTESWSLQDGRAAPAERESVSYAGNPDPVPFPVPAARFDGIEIARLADGQVFRASVNLTVGAAEPFAIGPCLYTGLPVSVARVDLAGGPLEYDSMMHLVELGVTLYLGYSDTGTPPEPSLPLSISLLPPVAGGMATHVPPPLPNLPGDAAVSPKN